MAIGDGVGKRIQRAREMKGFTKSDLARATGVSTTAVWNWEQNELTPRMPTMIKVAACLDVSVDFLQTGSDSAHIVNEKVQPLSVAAMIEETRAKIAQATGFAVERVKLHLEFATD